ncbi:hypothetical protein ACY2DA_01630 [Staphylococcus simulans]
MNNLNDQMISYIDLVNVIESHHTQYQVDDREQLSIPKICKAYGKYASLNEKQVLESILKYHPEVTIIPEDKAESLNLLMETGFVYEIEKNAYYVDVDFLNDFNQYVLNNKYDAIPPLDDDEEEALYEMSSLMEARRDYESLELIDMLVEYNMTELKQICRDYQIKGFSKHNMQGLIAFIHETFTNNPSLIFKNLTQNELSLLAYFVVEDSHVIPLTHLDALSLKLFFIQIDHLYDALYMPPSILDEILNYFEEENKNPLDYLEVEDRELLEDIERYKKINNMPFNEEEDIETAISAFVEAGKDEEMREMFNEIFELDQDTPDAKVISAIIDGKVTSQEELDQFLETLNNPEANTHKQNNQSSGNIIDFNQYRK